MPTWSRVTRATSSLNALPALGGAGGPAEVGVDDLDGSVASRTQGPLPEGVLELRLSWLVRTWCGLDWRM